MKQLKQVHYFKSITDPKAPKDFIHKDERYCFSTFSVSGLAVLVWVPHMQGLLSEAGGSESPFSTPQTTPLRPALRGRPFGGSRGVSKEKINPRLSQEENSSDQNHPKFLLMVINGYHYMLLLLSCYDKTLLSQVATVAIGFPNSSSSELWWCNFGEEIHSSSRRLRK